MLFTLLVFVTSNLSPVFSHAEAKRNENLTKMVKKFVPSKSLLVNPEEPVSTKSFQLYDFDQDGQKEIIITFETKARIQYILLLHSSGY